MVLPYGVGGTVLILKLSERPGTTYIAPDIANPCVLAAWADCPSADMAPQPLLRIQWKASPAQRCFTAYRCSPGHTILLDYNPFVSLAVLWTCWFSLLQPAGPEGLQAQFLLLQSECPSAQLAFRALWWQASTAKAILFQKPLTALFIPLNDLYFLYWPHNHSFWGAYFYLFFFSPNVDEKNTLKIVLLSTVLLVVYRPFSLPKSNALLLMKSPSSYKTTCKTPVWKAQNLRFILSSTFSLSGTFLVASGVHVLSQMSCVGWHKVGL